MGASQSSGAGAPGGAPGGASSDEVKTSYYELLGVDRSATDDEYDPSVHIYEDTTDILKNQESIPTESASAPPGPQPWRRRAHHRPFCADPVCL